MYKLLFSEQVDEDLQALENHGHLKKQLKAVRKTLGYLELNPRHPSLNTHKFHSLSGPDGEDIFACYAENHTPGAYRIFWFYGPDKKHITVIAITPHP